jgi:hypothetical protein
MASVLTPMPTAADVQALATAQGIPVDFAKLIALRNWKIACLNAIRAEAQTAPANAVQDFIDFILLVT